MNIAGHGATGLNILRSHSKNSYTAVSGGLLNCQSFNHRGTQGKIPRLLSESGPRFIPEDFNESIERLAIYADEVEHRAENRIKNQLRCLRQKFAQEALLSFENPSNR